MSQQKISPTAKLIGVLVLIPIFAAVWYALPLLLPMWRWQHVDGWPWISYPEHTWAAISNSSKIPENKLRTEFTFVVRYAPRNVRAGVKDPYPWQIVSSIPAWIDHMPETEDDETNTLVRVVALSERDGLPRSSFGVGGGRDEVYYRLKGWRFPAKTFGQTSNHPVIMYQGNTLEEHLPIGEGQVLNTTVDNMPSDDDWEDRADNFGKPADE